jgi:Fe-S-cluster-containing hydrogenase component 2
MHAARNLDLCTKDCICLFVCPTGATNTETGQIDFEKCLSGCRLCVDACPSHAIYLVYDNYPDKKEKDETVVKLLNRLLESKAQQELIVKELFDDNLAKALAHSNRVLAEDCAREASFMLAQSKQTKSFLQNLLKDYTDKNFPVEAVKELLEIL